MLCYNEIILLPHTIAHYKKNFPNCKITIYDNYSTDGSDILAESLGCNVIKWDSNNQIDDHKYLEIKNNCWKHVDSGWIIVCDMDEWLQANVNDLLFEDKNNTSILTTKGYDIVITSIKDDFNDVDPHNNVKGIYGSHLSKSICFNKNKISEINYDFGAHKCSPIGTINYSEKEYIIKHNSKMGLMFLINKMVARKKRAHEMQKQGLAVHYNDNIENITKDYCMSVLGELEDIPNMN